MTSLDRVLAALRFELPDRVPFFEQGVASNVASAALGREARTGGGTFRRDGVEAAMSGPDAYLEYVESYFSSWCDLVEALDFDVVTLPWAGGGAPTKKLDEQTYLFGDRDGAWEVLRHDPPSDTFYTLDSSLRHDGALDEIQERAAAMEARHDERVRPSPASFDLLGRLIERFGRSRTIGGGPLIGVPMEPAWWEAMAVMPDVVERYIEMQADCTCDEIEVLAGMGVHLVWGGGDLAFNGGPAYSPAFFRRFMLEPLKRVTSCCHRLGLPYFFRTDGVIWPIAQELFVESGVDGYGEIDKQAGMEIAEIRQRLPHLILWGNVDCGRTLTSGTRDQVAAETRACVDAAGRQGGYLLGSSNVIHAGVPVENFLTMVETCREYGRY